MPIKKKEGKTGIQSASWQKPDDTLQAILLADSFNFRFLPITLEKPRVLLPLVNCTLLDYTVDFLLSSGVKEIFVFCSCHAEQIKKYIKDPKWKSTRSHCTFHTIISKGCLSLGDALREIDRQGLIKCDFILVYGDLTANIKLDKILREHKERRQKNKSSVMTMVYKMASPQNRTRSNEENVFLAVESSTNRILHWERTYKKKKFSLPLELFSENTEIQLRYDLLDCGISICSVEVPQLFTDNFDYQTREDFVRGIIINEEVMGNKIHSFILEEEYGARVSNLKLYDSISKDIVNRWVYPIVPDNGRLNSNQYTFHRHNIYTGENVVLARDCVLEENVVVGCHSSVGEGTIVRNSVIGKHCIIGKNIVIEDSYLWDSVKIEDNCSISMSIICDNVHMKSNVSTQKGCVLSFNVVVGPDLQLPAGVRITLKTSTDECDLGVEKLSLDDNKDNYMVDEVGLEGRGYVWKTEHDSDNEDEQELTDIWGASSQGSEEGSSDDSMSGDGDSPCNSPPPEDTKLFYYEVLDTIRNGVSNQVNPDNLVLEINASKYAYNVTFRELNSAVTKAFLEAIMSNHENYDQGILKELKKAIEHIHPLFAHYMKEVENQKVGVLAAEDYFLQNTQFSPAFQTFLHGMYDKDVLEETVILSWYNNPNKEEENIPQENIRKQVTRFVTWLMEAEEESDSD